jgi:hypothetical protein
LNERVNKIYENRMTIRNQVQRNIKSKSNRFRFNLPVPSPREKGWDEFFIEFLAIGI